MARHDELLVERLECLGIIQARHLPEHLVEFLPVQRVDPSYVEDGLLMPLAFTTYAVHEHPVVVATP